MKREHPVQHFKRKISKDPDGCWRWTGSRDKDGYGKFQSGHPKNPRFIRLRAHRAAWMMMYGLIPDGLFVLHKCNNSCCVRIDHLYLGDHEENMKHRKQCGHYAMGEENNLSKFSKEKITEVYNSPGSEWSVARRLGVNRSLVNMVRSGKAWSHLFGGVPSPHHNSQRKRTKVPV